MCRNYMPAENSVNIGSNIFNNNNNIINKFCLCPTELILNRLNNK